MGKLRTIELSAAQRESLLAGYHRGATAAFGQRCPIILLKSQGRSSQQVDQIGDQNPITINTCLAREEQQGIRGLETKAGRGRKPILNLLQDAAWVKASVQAERQRLSQAKLELEKGLGKPFSLKTLKRFR